MKPKWLEEFEAAYPNISSQFKTNAMWTLGMFDRDQLEYMERLIRTALMSKEPMWPIDTTGVHR